MSVNLFSHEVSSPCFLLSRRRCSWCFQRIIRTEIQAMMILGSGEITAHIGNWSCWKIIRVEGRERRRRRKEQDKGKKKGRQEQDRTDCSVRKFTTTWLQCIFSTMRRTHEVNLLFAFCISGRKILIIVNILLTFWRKDDDAFKFCKYSSLCLCPANSWVLKENKA